MIVYVEYAFAENFLIDGLLLFLALKASDAPISVVRLLIAAALGACFAIVFPLIVLSITFSYLLRFSVGFLLCMVAFGRLKTKKEWGRYAFTCVFFFAFTFFFGGALTGMGFAFSPWIALGIAALTAFCLVFIRKLREKRAVSAFLYDCTAICGEKSLLAKGFLDSGNAASWKNTPVCFLSPDLLYELCGEEILQKTGGQVCDEMVITTLSGSRRVPLYKGEICIREKDGNTLKRKVYFSPSANMLKREYKILLPREILMK